MTRALVLSSLLALVAACGGAQTQPQSSAEPAATAVAPAPAPVVDKWTPELTQEQKAAFMKAKVTPHLGAVFQAFDATRYANFGCQTCHGPKGQAPKDFLPRLTIKDGQLANVGDKAEIVKLMMEKVTPEMVSTLGVPGFDEATHQGFGCNGCHAIDIK